MATLAEIRQKLASMESKPGGSNSQMDNAVYPFRNIAEGQSTTLRFLPDNDPDNILFWTERLMIRLPFPGIKGGDSRPVIVQVPCVEMYGGQCPVLQEVRPWFKDPSLEDMGRKYWKKKSYIFQGFVKEDALQEDTKPENPIRRFIIGPQIFNIIKGALMDPDMENIPTDYVNGTDFRLSKTTKGQYADYSTSKWARKESALTEEELSAVDTHGLHDLKSFLPKQPGDKELQVIKEMFEASVNGELYDPERWGSFYKPAGMQLNTTSVQTASAPAQAPAPAPATPTTSSSTSEESVASETSNEAVVQSVSNPTPSTPVEENASASNGNSSTEDILAMIRNRSTES